MKKKEIINHSTLYDTINFKAFNEANANEPSFLDSPVSYKAKTNKNYGTKPKVRKLSLIYKNDNKRGV